MYRQLRGGTGGIVKTRGVTVRVGWSGGTINIRRGHTIITWGGVTVIIGKNRMYHNHGGGQSSILYHGHLTITTVPTLLIQPNLP